ncbi:MAG: DUF928 domain-containing protein [Microcoleaceae cyanobacterium]
MGAPVSHQPVLSQATPSNPESSLEFRAPDLTGRGRPGERRGAASRGPCPIDPQDLYALVPPESQGKTISGYPTFWFRIDYPSNRYHSVRFQLRRVLRENRVAELVYEKTLPASEIPQGIVSLSLPETVRQLDAQPTYYEWSFSVYCNVPPETDEIGQQPKAMVFGSIVRVKPESELQQALQAASTERDRALVYAQYGLWYDSLTTLGQLHQADPEQADLTLDWQALLTQADLKEIVAEPITDCCQESR